jgi:hypothetical protein
VPQGPSRSRPSPAVVFPTSPAGTHRAAGRMVPPLPGENRSVWYVAYLHCPTCAQDARRPRAVCVTFNRCCTNSLRFSGSAMFTGPRAAIFWFTRVALPAKEDRVVLSLADSRHQWDTPRGVQPHGGHRGSLRVNTGRTGKLLEGRIIYCHTG